MFKPFEGKRFNLALVAAVTFGVGFLALGYLNYYQYTSNQQSQSLLNGQITDLTYQVKQDHSAGLGTTPSLSPSPSPTDSPSASPSPSPTPSPGPSPSPGVLGASTAAIKTRHNIHLAASSGSRVVLDFTQLYVGEFVTLDGSAQGGWQRVTVDGATGYTESDSF